MRLLLDIGNSAVKWMLAAGREAVRSGRFVHAGGEFAELAARAWSDLDVPQEVVVANVAGSALAMQLDDWVQRQWRLVPRFVTACRAAAGVSNAYPVPQRLGIDRWAAMVAAYDGCRSAVLVVDCGTAITLDLVDADGAHRGGLILAGIDMMASALLERTAGLRAASATASVTLLATDTGDAIAGGSVYAAAATIECLTPRMAQQVTGPMQVLITGGDAPRVLPQLTIECQHVPGLVLQGLAILAGDS